MHAAQQHPVDVPVPDVPATTMVTAHVGRLDKSNKNWTDFNPPLRSGGRERRALFPLNLSRLTSLAAMCKAAAERAELSEGLALRLHLFYHNVYTPVDTESLLQDMILSFRSEREPTTDMCFVEHVSSSKPRILGAVATVRISKSMLPAVRTLVASGMGEEGGDDDDEHGDEDMLDEFDVEFLHEDASEEENVPVAPKAKPPPTGRKKQSLESLFDNFVRRLALSAPSIHICDSEGRRLVWKHTKRRCKWVYSVKCKRQVPILCFGCSHCDQVFMIFFQFGQHHVPKRHLKDCTALQGQTAINQVFIAAAAFASEQRKKGAASEEESKVGGDAELAAAGPTPNAQHLPASEFNVGDIVEVTKGKHAGKRAVVASVCEFTRTRFRLKFGCAETEGGHFWARLGNADNKMKLMHSAGSLSIDDADDLLDSDHCE